jgi:uncharacterized damage-inducible protein DinB
MTRESIPVRDISSLECRTCGAGAPVDQHFCPNYSRILALGRHGDYFSFLGLPRTLVIDAGDLERRFRELSRRFHPDFYYNAPPAERLASLERSSYLNDAVRALRNPVSRIEHLLAIEGLPPAKSEEGTAKVPPGLLEEVFALNEELDEIRELRESGTALGELASHLATIALWGKLTLERTELDLGVPENAKLASTPFTTTAELLERFDAHVRDTRAALAVASDADMGVTWTLKNGGRTIFSMPRAPVFRSFVMNHTIHHRAQLGVYLRLRDVPLPSSYGPSADTPR